ncbi:MAG: HEAT repeat domain-containing protein [Verrucomicrobia bacterium]|nr:HEAT repeat domain-containing protein [Verrucomicrobiota bacterium]
MKPLPHLPSSFAAAAPNQKKASPPAPPPGPTPPMTEAACLAALAGSDQHDKARACQELVSVGTPAAVPALAALLDQENISDYARSALEGIKDPSASAALRKALGTAKGRQLAGVVNSLGVKRDPAAVGDLQKLALDAKSGVASEAVASLGMIASADATKTLQKILADGPADLKAPAAHAALMAAESLAKSGKPKDARPLLDAVVRAFPEGHLANVAKTQAVSLGAKRS